MMRGHEQQGVEKTNDGTGVIWNRTDDSNTHETLREWYAVAPRPWQEQREDSSTVVKTSHGGRREGEVTNKTVLSRESH